MRGSIPTPGPGTVRYGGNTTCVEIRRGSEIIILDAGTGLRKLGQSLVQEFRRQPLNLTLLLSHTHWDHIQGLPFFAPIYQARCHLRVLGCKGARASLMKALAGQMESPYFPVPFSQLPSNIEIEELREADFAVGQLRVSAHHANHPGEAVGYRISSLEGSVAFFPDVEPRNAGNDRGMIEFVRGADILILDSQYDRAEYRSHRGWGHGCVDHSVTLALQSEVKKLVLFHHDPDHDDRQVSALLRHARQLVARTQSRLKVDAAREGMLLQLGGQ